jgi:hypothetical protein
MTKPTLSRVLLTVSTFALLGVGFTLSSKKYSVDPQNPTYLAFEQKLSDDLKQGLDEYVQLVEENHKDIEKLVDVTTKQAEEKADVFTDLGMRPTKPAFDQGAVNNFVLSGGGYSFPSIPDYSGEAFTENFDKRWNQEVSDLEKVHAPIPSEKLHARALEILRERSAQLPVVAMDEENGQ